MSRKMTDADAMAFNREADRLLALHKHDVHVHEWKATGAQHVHAGERTAIYLQCRLCGRYGFRFNHSPVVYTWSNKADELEKTKT